MLEDLPIEAITLKTPSFKIISNLVQIPTLKSFVLDTAIPWYAFCGADIGMRESRPHNWLEPSFLPHLTYVNSGKFRTSPTVLGKLLGHTKNLESLLITVDSLRAYTSNMGTGDVVATIMDILEINPGLGSSMKELALLEPADAHFADPRIHR